jgi:hypothetical protein
MNRIEVAGIPFLYFAKADGIPPAEIEGVVRIMNPLRPVRWSELIVPNMNLIRPTVWIPSQGGAHTEVPLNFFYWDQAKDLEDLDARVSQGTYTVDDFSGAILTYSTAITCMHRYDWAADILEPEKLFPARAVRAEFEPRWLSKADNYMNTCPICSQKLNKVIVKVLQVREKPTPPPTFTPPSQNESS